MSNSEKNSKPEAVSASVTSTRDSSTQLLRPLLREESAEQIGEVLALLVHDLRNPLAALSSNVGFVGMSAESFPVEIREAVTDLELSIEALGRLVDSLDLVSKDLKGAPLADGGTIELNSLLQGVWPAAERTAQSYGVQLITTAAEAGMRLKASELMLRRALSALLQNAITAAPSGSEVHVSFHRLAAHDEQGEMICIRVRDLGVPLSEELALMARSATGQVEIKAQRAGRYSRGLGLYGVVRAVELAGGRFVVGQDPSCSVLELHCLAAG